MKIEQKRCLPRYLSECRMSFPGNAASSSIMVSRLLRFTFYNFSQSMMTTGTPDEVDAAVERLVDEVRNKGGKLIPDMAIGIADEAPIERVRAMFDPARMYAG